LGDRLGTNFKELIGILNYSIGKFDLQGQVNYAKYGLDAAGQDNRKNINLPYIPTTLTMTNTGQGISTGLYYAEGTAAYLINPRYNLGLEIGALYRDETNSLGNKKTAMITFGLRSTFRDLNHGFYNVLIS
jgi:hypothetical protein